MQKPDNVVTASCLPPEQGEEIRTQLERVLNSRHFRGSRRCQILLRHVTEQTLAGDTLALKERTLGINVFGRPPDYDTSQDPVVRATAAETRKKLAQYYQEPVHEPEPRIELLPGSYVPEFHLNGINGKAPAPAPRPHWRRWRIAATAGATAMLAALALSLLWPGWRVSDVERFWGPTLHASGPILICVGQPIAYNLRSAQAQDTIQGIGGPQPVLDSNPEAIPKKDLVILPDRYVALGDALCLVHLTALFERYGKAYRIRGEHSTSFADLRENPSVLIAAFDNQWTLRTAGQRFTFAKDSAHDTDMVRDAQHPDNRDWKLTGAWPYWDVPNDYAIVSRVRDVNSDRPVVIAAGITQYGTMATGEFLTTPDYLSDAISKLPRDWQKKNLQIVLRVPVVRGTPGRPRVLATHVW